MCISYPKPYHSYHKSVFGLFLSVYSLCNALFAINNFDFSWLFDNTVEPCNSITEHSVVKGKF